MSVEKDQQVPQFEGNFVFDKPSHPKKCKICIAAGKGNMGAVPSSFKKCISPQQPAKKKEVIPSVREFDDFRRRVYRAKSWMDVKSMERTFWYLESNSRRRGQKYKYLNQYIKNFARNYPNLYVIEELTEIDELDETDEPVENTDFNEDEGCYSEDDYNFLDRDDDDDDDDE